MEDEVMAKVLVDDELWSVVEPLLPQWTRSPKGGQPRKPDRLCLTGILFVLKTGIPWEDFPQEMGCCGMTLWNRLHKWQEAGVWERLHRVLLAKLQEADALDWSRAAVDSASVRAVGGAKRPAPIRLIAANPDRNITFSRKPRAFPWRPGSPRLIATMSRN
jgi:transposase